MTDFATNQLGQPIGFAVPNWKPVPRPPKMSMEGRLVRLEVANPMMHAPDLFEAFAADRENRIWTYLPYGPFASAAEVEIWMHETCTGDDPMFFTIIERATSRALGLASFLRIEPKMGVIEVGHINFAPVLQRTPHGTEAMFLMMCRVFDELGYRRYEWKCDALNAPSYRAAERLGFVYEGTFRQATMYKGRNRDTSWYAIIDKDWPALKEAYEAWLNPDNFDADGEQRKKLSAFRRK